MATKSQGKPGPQEPGAVATEPSSRHWLTDESPAEWLREEYRLLSEHYFHEDNALIKTIGVYATLSSGLLAFTTSQFAAQEPQMKFLVSIVGLIFSFTWVAAVVRLREWRSYISARIESIERELHSVWGLDDFRPLDIKTFRHWQRPVSKWPLYKAPYYLVRAVPSSLTFIALPLAFTAVWFLIIIIHMK